MVAQVGIFNDTRGSYQTSVQPLNVFTDTLLGTGTVTDDHDNIQWVRVRIDDGNWTDIDWTGGEWSYLIDASSMDRGDHVFTIMVSDGRSEVSENRTLFREEEHRRDSSGEWPRGIPQIPILLALLAVVVLLARKGIWRGTC